MGLVDYDSGSDTENPRAVEVSNQTIYEADYQQSRPLTNAKRRKRPLPSLPDTYDSGIGPNDDPAQHQGRKRTRPYVDGDYDTHIYLSLKVPRRLQDEIRAFESSARRACPGADIHSFVDQSKDLHVSLTHAFPLRQSQIAPFKSRIRSAISTARTCTFQVSLAGRAKVYYNGKRFGGEGHGGRAFLALRVGAGVKEIDEIVEKILHPILREYHRPLYHSNPEYHASFAWCLTGPEPSAHDDEPSPHTAVKGDDGCELAAVSNKPARTPISNTVIDKLNSELEGRLLAAQPKSGWRIEHVVLKIGKDATLIPL